MRNVLDREERETQRAVNDVLAEMLDHLPASLADVVAHKIGASLEHLPASLAGVLELDIGARFENPRTTVPAPTAPTPAAAPAPIALRPAVAPAPTPAQPMARTFSQLATKVYKLQPAREAESFDAIAKRVYSKPAEPPEAA